MNKLITHLTMCVMLILCFSSGFAQTAPDFSGGHLRELYLEGTGNGYQAANILYPFDGSVIQRQSDGKANLSFCAQIGYGFKNSQMYDYSLRLTKLDLFSGLPQSPFTTITNFSLSLSNVVGDVATINSFINVNQGWYLAQLIISLKNGEGEFIAAHIKFGVGDTFIIAGQSNARGFHGGWDRFSDGSGELISYDNTLNNSMLPDASRVIGAFKLLVTSESVEANKSNREYFKSKILNGGMPFFRPFIKLDLYNPYSTENGINYYERGIYPFGLASWCWAPFGKKYIETYQIPVQFFNTAIDGSNISEWQKGAAPKAGFYNNMYDGLFSLIQFQGNILGHKAILWHQGESDVQIGTSNSNYKTKLESLVNNLQNDYDPWQPGRVWAPLNWVISKVSHSNQYNPSTQQIVTITNDPTNIKGAQINATPQSNGSVKITGIDSDSYGESYRAPYGKIHFTGPSHSLIADMWKNMNLQNLTPKIGQQGIAPISITYNTGTNQYTLTPPAGKGTYYWVKNEESINSASIITGNGQLVVSSGGLLDRDVYTCYYKNPYGTNYLMCQPFIVPNNYDRYSSLEATTVNTFSSSGETKIATVSSSNVSWSSNITYDNPANTGWINILSNNTGFIGNSGLVIQTNSNSGSQRSGKVVLNGNDGNGNYFTKQINIVQNASGAIFPLVSLTPTNSSFEWQGYGNAKFNGTSIDANTLQIGGVQYFQGIGTHSPSIIKYSLSNQYSNFFGKVGRDDEADNTYDSGKVEFVIKGDGVVLWTSQIHGNNTTAEPFSVNISGKNELELIVNALDDNYFDHADWVDLYLTTSGGGGCSTPTNPSNVSASSSSITSGQSTTLSASCSVGTITWSTGQTGASVSVSPTVSTTYQVSCVNGACQSGTVPVSITVNPSGGGGACSAISNNLTMGTWTVTGQPLVARYFHGQYWLTQKVSSSPDEFVVRGAAMLQRSDVTLNNSSYYNLINCFSWIYSDYGNLQVPNSSTFPTPAGYNLVYSQDGTPYYSASGAPPSGIVSGNCYKLRSLANNNYVQAMSNGEVQINGNNNQNDQKWKVESIGTSYKVTTMNGSGQVIKANSLTYSSGLVLGNFVSGNNYNYWNFENNAGNYRVSAPSNQYTWDHEGAGSGNHLQIYGTTSEQFIDYRLFAFEGTTCPSGLRVAAETDVTEEEKTGYMNFAPNPTSGAVEVKVNLTENGEVNVSLTDFMGRDLESKTYQGIKGNNSFDFKASNLPAGVYLLRVKSKGKIESKKIVIE